MQAGHISVILATSSVNVFGVTHSRRMMKRLHGLLAVLPILLSMQTFAQERLPLGEKSVIRFGILAHRPKPLVEAQWHPLIAHLNRTVRHAHFTLHPLTYVEMEAAVAQKKIDVVLTQPAFYVYLSKRYGLSFPMVTRIDFERETPIRYFGGTIVVRRDRHDLMKLSDLKGKSIATPSRKTFGGYLTIAYEMERAGIALPSGQKLHETGMPHDQSVMAVLNRTADAAFIRTGVVEDMLREGKLTTGQLRVLNQQPLPGIPFAASTRLYPEWPVAAMPHIEDRLASEIAAALLMLPHRGVVAKKIRIEGFNVPMDYRPVEDVLMALRQPPYDAAPRFTVADICKKYKMQLLIAGVLLGLILLLFVLVIRYNRHLQQLRLRAQKGDSQLRQLSARVPGMIYQYHVRTDGTSHYPYASDASQKLFGLNAEQLNEDAERLISLIHPEDVQQFRERIRQSADAMQEWHAEFRVVLPDAGEQWRLSNATPERLPDGSVIWHGYSADITDRKKAEAQSALLAAALEASANAITITDLSGRMEWVNQAFVDMTGYAREELMGQNPRLFKSAQHEPEFYAAMWRDLQSGKSWRGEIVNRRKDGTLHDEELFIAPVADERGRVHHYIGIKQDISERKRMEEELRRQATTDSLTGLSNRRYFFDRAEEELARIKRKKASEAAIVMLDIDFFKRVNDTYGHHVGDVVLKQAADTMLRAIRRMDCCGRLGGEEFAVLLHQTSLEEALQFSERLRQIFEKTPVVTETTTVHFTVSFGVTIMNEAETSVDDAIMRADQALYSAKEKGRNRVEVAY